MDLAKVKIVVKWGKPNTVTNIRSFLGLTGYHHKFVNGFLSIVTPRTGLTKKNTKFERNDNCESSFN